MRINSDRVKLTVGSIADEILAANARGENVSELISDLMKRLSGGDLWMRDPVRFVMFLTHLLFPNFNIPAKLSNIPIEFEIVFEERLCNVKLIGVGAQKAAYLVESSSGKKVVKVFKSQFSSSFQNEESLYKVFSENRAVVNNYLNDFLVSEIIQEVQWTINGMEASLPVIIADYLEGSFTSDFNNVAELSLVLIENNVVDQFLEFMERIDRCRSETGRIVDILGRNLLISHGEITLVDTDGLLLEDEVRRNRVARRRFAILCKTYNILKQNLNYNTLLVEF